MQRYDKILIKRREKEKTWRFRFFGQQDDFWTTRQQDGFLGQQDNKTIFRTTRQQDGFLGQQDNKTIFSKSKKTSWYCFGKKLERIRKNFIQEL